MNETVVSSTTGWKWKLKETICRFVAPSFIRECLLLWSEELSLFAYLFTYLLAYLLTFFYLVAYFCIVICLTENCITKLGKLNNFQVYNVSVFRNWPNFAKGGVHKLRLQDKVGRLSKNVHFFSMYTPLENVNPVR